MRWQSPDLCSQSGKPGLFISCHLLQPLNNSWLPVNSNPPSSLSPTCTAIMYGNLGCRILHIQNSWSRFCPSIHKKGRINFPGRDDNLCCQSLNSRPVLLLLPGAQCSDTCVIHVHLSGLPSSLETVLDMPVFSIGHWISYRMKTCMFLFGTPAPSPGPATSYVCGKRKGTKWVYKPFRTLYRASTVC